MILTVNKKRNNILLKYGDRKYSYKFAWFPVYVIHATRGKILIWLEKYASIYEYIEGRKEYTQTSGHVILHDKWKLIN